MTTYKHTPGPWTFAPLSTASRFRATQQEERFGIYADTAPEGHRMPAEAQGEANARLIAAAPDLLEALEALVFDFDSHSTADESISRARAALKKARGEE